jgi:hypothetical protein
MMTHTHGSMVPLLPVRASRSCPSMGYPRTRCITRDPNPVDQARRSERRRSDVDAPPPSLSPAITRRSGSAVSGARHRGSDSPPCSPMTIPGRVAHALVHEPRTAHEHRGPPDPRQRRAGHDRAPSWGYRRKQSEDPANRRRSGSACQRGPRSGGGSEPPAAPPQARERRRGEQGCATTIRVSTPGFRMRTGSAG